MMRRLLVYFGVVLSLLFLVPVIIPVGHHRLQKKSISARIEAPSATGQLFVVHLRVGQHRVKQFLNLDTGSGLTWIHCAPYEMLQSRSPLYNWRRSSTYRVEPCRGSDYCPGGNREGCDPSNRCVYHRGYAAGGSSEGVISRETFVFGDAVLKDVVFGCSKKTDHLADGVLGLSEGVHSLPAQLSCTRFSYCLGKITDKGNNYSRLIIGEPIKARLKNNEIPMVVYGKYYVGITRIEIGGVVLDCDMRLLRGDARKGTGGMAIDSGAAISYFPRLIYNRFAAAIGNLVELEGVDYRSTRLCFRGRFHIDLAGFPTVRFWFGGSARMELEADSIFQQWTDDIFCLAFGASEDMGPFNFGIMGLNMQQGHYMSFDLKASTFAFVKMDCAALDHDEQMNHDEL